MRLLVDECTGPAVARWLVTNGHDVILLRLADERAVTKIQVLEQLLHQHADQLAGNFVVASEESARIVHLPHQPS